VQREKLGVPRPHTRAVVAWNKGRLIGPKPPLKPKQVWAIRLHLEREERLRDLAMLDLAIDSKLRGCDLVRLKVRPAGRECHRPSPCDRRSEKTGQPVQFELTERPAKACSPGSPTGAAPSRTMSFPAG
jgi:hypothetical protein